MINESELIHGVRVKVIKVTAATIKRIKLISDFTLNPICGVVNIYNPQFI